MSQFRTNVGKQASGCRNDTDGPEPPSREQNSADFQELALALGADEKCVRDNNFFNRNMTDYSQEAQMGEASVLGLIGGSHQSFHTRLQNDNVTNNRLRETGCGSLAINVSQIGERIFNMACTMEKNMSSANVRSVSNASVRLINHGPTKEALAVANNQIEQTQKTLRLSLEDNVSDKRFKKVAGLAEQAQQALVDMTTTTISNSSFTITSDINISSLNENLSETSVELHTDVTAIVQSSAQNYVEMEMGFQGMTPEMRSMVNHFVDRQTSNISEDIVENLTNTNIEVDANNNVILEFNGALNMDNFHIDVHTTTNVSVHNIAMSAVQRGRTIGMEIVNEAILSNNGNVESRGVDDFTKEQLQAWKELTSQLGDNFNKSQEIGFRSIVGEHLETAYNGLAGLVDSFFSGITSAILAYAIPLFAGVILFLLWKFGILGGVAGFIFGGEDEESPQYTEEIVADEDDPCGLNELKKKVESGLGCDELDTLIPEGVDGACMETLNEIKQQQAVTCNTEETDPGENAPLPEDTSGSEKKMGEVVDTYTGIKSLFSEDELKWFPGDAFRGTNVVRRRVKLSFAQAKGGSKIYQTIGAIVLIFAGLNWGIFALGPPMTWWEIGQLAGITIVALAYYKFVRGKL